MTQENWTLHLCERPTWQGRRLSAALLGKPLGHTFLALTNPEGMTIGELHAGSYEDTPTQVLSARSRFAEVAVAVASLARVDAPTRSLITAARISPAVLLGFRVTAGKEQFRPERSVAVAAAASPADMKDVWTKMCAEAFAFNTRRVPYTRYAHAGDRQNCQSATRWVLGRVGIDMPAPPFTLAVPGWRNVHG